MSDIFDDGLYELDTSLRPPAGDLPPFLKEADFRGMVNPISKQLFFDVASATKDGTKKLTVNQSDTFYHVVDYLDRNKGKIVVNILVSGACCAITLGAGPAIGLAGKVVSWAVIQAFVALRVKYNRYKIQQFKNAGGKSTKTENFVSNVTDASGKNKEFEVIVNDERYGAEILDRVRYVIQNSDFTNVHDAFSDMFRDFEKFRKYFTFPKITNADGLDENGQSNMVISAQFIPGSIKTCGDAIELWELVCRFAARKNKIRAIAELLDEFVMYVEMELSKFTAESIKMARDAWTAFTVEGKRDPALVVQAMKDYSYRVKTGGWFRDLFSIGVNVKTFYGAIPMIVKNEEFGRSYGDRIFLELLRREEVSKFKEIAGQYFDKAVGIGKLQTDKLQQIMKHPKYRSQFKDKWMKTAASKGIEVGFAMLDAVFTGYSPISLEALKNMEMPNLDDFMKGVTDLATAWGATAIDTCVIKGEAFFTTDTFFGQFMSGTEFASFGVDIVVNTLADIAFDWWDRKKLANNAQTAAKRLGTMKKFAKDQIEDYVDLIESWSESYNKAMTSGGFEMLPPVIECFRHEAAMDANMARHFFGELTIMFNKMDMLMDSVYRQSAVEINSYINGHAARAPGATTGALNTTICKGYCYNCAENGMKRIIAAAAGSVNAASKLKAEDRLKLLNSLRDWETKLETEGKLNSVPCTPVYGSTKPTTTPLSVAKSIVKELGIKL